MMMTTINLSFVTPARHAIINPSQIVERGNFKDLEVKIVQVRFPLSLFSLNFFSFSWLVVQSWEAILETLDEVAVASSLSSSRATACLTHWRRRLTQCAAFAHRLDFLAGGCLRMVSRLVDSAMARESCWNHGTSIWWIQFTDPHEINEVKSRSLSLRAIVFCLCICMEFPSGGHETM